MWGEANMGNDGCEPLDSDLMLLGFIATYQFGL